MTVEWHGNNVIKQVHQAVFQGVVRGTEAVREEAIDLILSTAKTGRLYRRRTVTHQASAPGEPPASDTGRLVQSIRTQYRATELTGLVIAGTEYAAYLEYGTNRMEPRPFMRPALAKLKSKIEDDIANSISMVLS